MASWKESMIYRLSNLINRNRSAAKISQVLCSIIYPIFAGECKQNINWISDTFAAWVQLYLGQLPFRLVLNASRFNGDS